MADRRPSSTSALDDYPATYLACRDLQHAWEIDSWYREGGEIRRVLLCNRCGTERHDRWTRSAERLNGSYVYADDYMVEGGVDRVDVRLAAMGRARVYASYEEAREAAARRQRRKNGRAT